MSDVDLTKKELFIKNMFLSKKNNPFSDEEVLRIIKKISSIGNSFGFIGEKENKDQSKSEKRKHKYDVWIAKEAMRDVEILNFSDRIRFILDWAVNTKANIFNYNYKDALREQKNWHEEMFKKLDIEKIKIPELDEKRILFRCKDKEHFFYLLETFDLKYEGVKMKNCIKGSNYVSKVKNKRSFIVSLRDSKNEPHVSIEIDVSSKEVLQSYGKTNTSIKPKHKNLIIEFALFFANYPPLREDETLKFLNSKYL